MRLAKRLLRSSYSPVIFWFDLQQTATKVISSVSGTEKFTLYHTKSHGGKCENFTKIEVIKTKKVFFL